MPEKRNSNPETTVKGRKYILVDACVLAAYYMPESGARFTHLAERATILINGIKNNPSCDSRLLIPSVCIPEVFSIFSKFRFGKGNPHVKKTVNDLRYWRARLDFHNDIHNGKYIQQLELSRYHILATDLISPIDHHYEYYRSRNPSKKRRKVPMGAFDHTIIGMGIDLVKCRGLDNVIIVTSDRRLGHILDKTRRVPRKTAARLGLLRIAKDLGLKWGPHIYPEVVNIATARETLLGEIFGEWPIKILKREKPKSSLPLTSRQKEELISIYNRVTKETSESFTYTDEFEILYEAFLAKTGLDLDRTTVWKALSNLRKQKKLPKKRDKKKK
ncbi:MAG: hypothetical protein ACYS18_06525 [Planctomycetota bacterium]|jgi:hypothetical protein